MVLGCIFNQAGAISTQEPELRNYQNRAGFYGCWVCLADKSRDDRPCQVRYELGKVSFQYEGRGMQ